MVDGVVSAGRIARIRRAMAEANLDAMYLRTTTNIAWATGFVGVFDEEQAHALLVTKNLVWLHTDSRYVVALSACASDTEIEVSMEQGGHFSCAIEVLGSMSHTPFNHLSVGVEDAISLREFRAIEGAIAKSKVRIDLVETSGIVEGLRSVKDSVEVSFMRRAQEITDAGFSHICSFMKAGMTERQVQLELDRFMMAQGAEGLAFPTIVATGAHAASPHAQPGDTVLTRGDAVVMDFGARYHGYCSDMTRTVFVGEPSNELKKAWKTLRQANEECEAMVSEGVTASRVHAHAEKVLARGGFAGRMGHALGHSVGLDIHETPTFSPRNDEPLDAGVVITVEPGIYVEGSFGMRLEDFGVVTEEGFDVLTHSTHEMVIIGDCD